MDFLKPAVLVWVGVIAMCAVPLSAQAHVLTGNTRPEANSKNDLGPVEDDFRLDHMILQLKRPAAAEQALQEQIGKQQDPSSPDYHHWMTAAEFGAAYGAAPADREKVVAWLQSHGFTVGSVAAGGTTIDFSGTAAQVKEAFATEIHYLNVNGVKHVANMSDPSIPESLASAVAGIVSLHDFSPHAMKRARADYTFATGGSTYHAVTPGDLATIYNLNPLFAEGVTGTGQTIAVIEDSDLYSTADWSTFRTAFGLSKYTGGSLATVHPAPAAGANNCKDPGVVGGDDGEAAIDSEYASAAAPNAAIVVAACASTRATFGGLIALQNLVDGSAPPAIVSISYGECEAENGAGSNAAFNSVYQQAVAEGISIFVSAGDSNAAGCDAGASGATHGVGVSAYASTPYNVAVGGTDFGDTVAGTASAYWSASNPATYASALSYIPEIPWNDSCAGSLLAGHFGYTTVYGAAGFCGSAAAKNGQYLVVAGGSGGPSGCATGIPASAGVVGGTCAGYAKPSWQTGVAGIAADGVRDLPDVSLFAADGVWGHFYVDCWSDRRNGGASCAGSPSSWDSAGGTSFDAPILAGIQALVNQKNGGAQGNPNHFYYKLAAIGAYFCNSSGATEAGCIFHNVTQGDNDVNCGGTTACFGATQSAAGSGRGFRGGGGQTSTADNGALSTSTASFAPAYKAGAGWNFATGLGSVDAYNLVTHWSSGK
jgi:subtilase family serine protease